MADQTPIVIDAEEVPTLFGVEVPKHVNMQFLYAALQAAQAHSKTQDARIESLQKSVRALFAQRNESPQQAVTVAEVAGVSKEKPAPREFLCTVCTHGTGERVAHESLEVTNQHLALKKEAEREHGKPPKQA